MSSIYMEAIIISGIYLPLGIMLGYSYEKKGWLYAMMPPLLINLSNYLSSIIFNKYNNISLWNMISFISISMLIGISGGIIGQLGQIITRKIKQK